MHTPRPPRRVAPPHHLAALVLVALAAIGVAVAASSLGSVEPSARTAPASAWQGLVGGARSEVVLGQRVIVVLRGPSLAQRLERLGRVVGEAQQRRWTTATLAAQRQLVARLAAEGLRIEPEFSYQRVLSGFSAALDAQSIALLERAPEVDGVYPTRVAYPAAVPDVDLAPFADGSSVSLPGVTGRGVTIALLDTGVDRFHPALRGRVQPGWDIVDRDRSAAPEAAPGRPAAVEDHGTELAGLALGAADEGGPQGVAPGAALLPIRVAGWQETATGESIVYARTDQLIAGLERAVDPNGNGDVLDAARVALVGVAEPYAAFADSPGARAVAGAAALDTLVVTPAGNDGPGGPRYGSVSGPGGAAAALTVGAADLRTSAESVRVLLRAGLEVEFAGSVPLAGKARPSGSLTLDVADPTQSDVFDEDGLSLVAGKAALVDGSSSAEAAVRDAARAGAAAVLVYGSSIPSGALGLADVSVPVVSIPHAAAERALEARERGGALVVSIGAARTNGGRETGIASFSSSGLAYGGRVKPDLLAPGVALAAASPGRTDLGAPRFGTVSGSSAAAAVVAGAAALLAEARPELDAASLRGLLVGTGKALPETSLRDQGNGLVDVGAAAAGEVSVEPATISFSPVRGRRWQDTSVFVVRNVTARRLAVRIEAPTSRGLAIGVTPARFRLAPGTQQRVFLGARLAYLPRDRRPVEGALDVTVAGGALQVRVPWLVTFQPSRTALLGQVTLATRSFKPSDKAPSVLAFRAGQIEPGDDGPQIEPVGRLELELWNAEGERLGVLARMRNLLPGRYAFGLTGRAPTGRRLAAGRYSLRLLAFGTDDAPPSRRQVRFTIK